MDQPLQQWLTGEKSGEDKNTKIWISFWRAIIWWKITIWQKIADTSFKVLKCQVYLTVAGDINTEENRFWNELYKWNICANGKTYGVLKSY